MLRKDAGIGFSVLGHATWPGIHLWWGAPVQPSLVRLSVAPDPRPPSSGRGPPRAGRGRRRQLAKTIARYGRVDLLCIDELGYMELDRRGAEVLFRVLTERDETASVANDRPAAQGGRQRLRS
jgi:IstB-like ATP binding protein